MNSIFAFTGRVYLPDGRCLIYLLGRLWWIELP